ncbi:MAG: NAD+ synthase [Candidatus Omnitrophica bacterium]|nr:NAD+ synthase [Candidatus Omnitrophota bacterium]
MRIAIAQINSTVGDIKGNSEKIISSILKARREYSDIVIFPELAISGYPPEDLLLKKAFLKDAKGYLKCIIDASRSIFAVVGFPDHDKKGVYNAAALIYDGKLIDIYRKIKLPNYGVFDERRYFTPGTQIPIIPFADGTKATVGICEDIWHPLGPHRTAKRKGGAGIIINISASPYHAGKILERQKMLRKRAVENRAFVCYCNLVGGQDELVFDGGSLIYGPDGRLVARARQFEEDMLIADLDISKPKNSISRVEAPQRPIAQIHSALALGLRDYVRKNDFKKVVLGLSGGIDSAVSAAIACEALGRKNVTAVSMPSRYTSSATKADAKRLANNLGIKLITIPVNSIYKSYISSLKKIFSGKSPDITEENLQARIRGNTLMALSNKFGWLVITTGNKSEVSVGYCTLYGDTAGGFGVIKDVPKTLVYKLALYINKRAGKSLIPKTTIKRAPTAELKPGQKDRDILPPYSILDKILNAYIEKDSSREKIMGLGYGKQTVRKVISMVDKNEYKRRQSPPGVKITPKAFGRDRRMPIVNKFSR